MTQRQMGLRRASLMPSKAVPGGLFGDVNGTVVDAEYQHWTYPGTTTTVPALVLSIVDDSGTEWKEQVWTCGRIEVYSPSADGAHMDIAGDAEGFPSNSHLMALATSLVNSGFPENRLDGPKGCKELIGLSAFWRRQKTERRIRNEKDKTVTVSDRESTIVVVSKIHKLPWENTGGSTPPTPPIAAAPPITVPMGAIGGSGPLPIAQGDNLTILAQTVVAQALGASGGNIDRAALNGWIVNNPQSYGGDPTLMVPLINLISQPGVLAGMPGVKVEGSVVSLG